jgi:uncharacterized repeat protein (TIGR01451 family)
LGRGQLTMHRPIEGVVLARHGSAVSEYRRRTSLVGLALVAGWLLLPLSLFAQVDEAAGRGRIWLLSRQNLDGSFGSLPDLVPRDSGAAVLGLLASGSAGVELDRGLIYLAGVPERAAEFRARRALALGRGGRPVAGLLESLGEFENGGGYGAFGTYESNLLDTALAVQALALEEEGRLLAIVPLLDYLQLHQNPDGGWGYVPGDGSRVYFTAEAALALAGLDRLAVPPESLAAARSFLLGRQLPDGSFGSPLETALAYRALLALGTEVSTLLSSPVAFLLGTQAADGSWQGDVFTTGQVVVALGGEAPNLVVSEVLAEPETLLPGEAVTVTATVRNIGPSPAGESHLEIRAGDPQDGEVRGAAAVPELAPGEAEEVQVVIATVDDAGELVLHAVADAENEVDEGDEADNTRPVRVNLRTEPDLALYGSDLTVSPARPAPDTGFRLLISARNQGETEVETFTYRVAELVAGEPAVVAEGTAGPAMPGAGVLIEVPLALPEGEHLLRVELDPEDAVAEAREDNNVAGIAFFVVDEDLPDLAIAETDLTASPAKPAVGEAVVASVTVRNPGARGATAVVELWDGEPGAGVLITSQVATVPAGGAQAVSGSFIAGTETIALVAVADPAHAVEELSEANNRARRFVVDRPDLAIGIDNLELAPLDPLVGETVQGAVTVRNAGTVAATGVAVAVFQGDPEAGGAEIFTGTLPDLPPGGNRTLTFTWTAAGGLHALTAVADPDDAVAELSETNNRAAREVAVPRPGGPNLTVSTLDLSGLDHSPLTLAAAGPVVVTVANDGDSDAGAFLVRLVEERDGDGRPSAGDRELAVESIAGGVPAGGSAAVSLTLDTTFPFFRPLIHVELDPTDLVPERREDDNRRALFGACRADSPAASFDAVEEWYLPGLEVESVPVVVQLTDDDGDGRIDSRDVPDVVFHTEDAGGRAVTARSGLDGSEVWTVRSTAADPLEGRIANLAAADLDGDGVAEVIAIRGGGRLVAIHHTGRILWVSDRVESAGGYNWAGGPSVGDLDGDGVPEIVVGRSVLSNTGRLLAQGTANVGRNHNYYGPFGVPFLIDAPFSTIADVDLDGRSELVAGDALYRLEDGVLQVVWNRTVPDNLMVDGFTAVGNLDGDPKAEIVYVSTNQVMVLNHDGSILRASRLVQPIVPFGNRTVWAGPPSLGDLDGDGATDILIAASKELFALRANLSTLWRVPTSEASEMTFAVAFDLDGDGADEVLYLDETQFRILDGATGATLYSRPNTSKTATEGPVVADVDGDGRAEILVPSNRSFGGDRSTQGLHVLGHPSWRGTRPIWNQHTFHGTNVQADGTVPARETPAWLAGAGFRTNLELPDPERLLPNLTVSLTRVGRSGADGVPVVLRIGNGGLAPVPPGALVALYDADPAAGAPPVAKGVTEAVLRPGGFEDVPLLWQVAGAAGQPAWAEVDPEGAEEECAEEDNVLAFVMTESVLPDLAIPAGGVTASGPYFVGQRVPVSVEVENAGAAEATAFTIRLFDGDPASGRVAAEAAVGRLAPGEATTVAIPWDTLGTLPGRHALHAMADADDLLLETTENNNRGLLEVELVEPSLPDLSIEAFAVEPAVAASGETVHLSARVTNRGSPLAAGFPVAFLVNRAEVGRVEVPEALATAEERTVELPWSTAGRQGLLAVEVVADPGGAVAEVNEGNNRAAAELSVTGATLSAAIATGKASYAPGETVAVTATAQNAATDPRDIELRVWIADAAGVPIAELGSETVTLPAGVSSFDFAWETGAALPGTHAAVAELRVGGSSVARAESLFSLARQVSVTASLFADRDLYPPGASALLAGRVTNASESTVLTALTARLAVLGPGGSERFAVVREIPVLYPGSEQRLETVWEVAASGPGAYTATLSLRDGAGLLLVFASAPLAVEDTSATGAGLRGELVVAPQLAGAGAPLVAEFTVENQGNADLPGLGLRVDLLDLDPGSPGEAVASQAVPQTLVRGATAALSLAFATTEIAAGDYLATLVAVLPGAELTLDRAAFTVAPGVSVGDASVAEGDSGTNLLRFPVTLSEALPEEVTVDFATADGTAEAGTDYQAASGALVFAAGRTEALVEVTVFGDLDPEPDEVILLTLGSPSGILLGDGQALGTIRDEEGCASPDLLDNGSAEAGSAADPVPGWEETEATGWRPSFGAPPPLEGLAAFAAPADAAAAELTQTVDLAAFAARIDAGLQPFLFEGFVRSAEEAAPDAAAVAIEYLDASGAVLDAFDSGEIVSAGAWRAVRDLRSAPSGTRAALVRLLARRAAEGASMEVLFDRMALRSVATPTVVVGDAEALEGNAGSTLLVLPVSLSCARTAPVRVDFATADSPSGTGASSGSDYLGASGTLTLAAGETAGTIEVAVLGDTLDEPDETFQVAISTPDEPVVLRAAAVGTIRDDDGPAVLSVADLNVAEGDAGLSEATLTVSLSSVSGKTVGASWSTAGGSAEAGVDYQASSGPVTLAAGETTATIAIPILGDRLNEPAEDLIVTLSAPQGAVLGDSVAVVTILDDDPIAIRVADARVVEGHSGQTLARFAVTLSVPSVSGVTVAYATSDLDALAGLDYLTSSGTLTIPPGETAREITVPVLGDTLKEPVESFLLTLSAPAGGHPTATLADPEAVGSIVDDDGILVSVADVTVREAAGGEAVFRVSLNKTTTVAVSVDFATVDGSAVAGADYEATAGTATIPAGALGADLRVSLVNDASYEPAETFSLVLSNPSGEAILLDLEAQATVLDDDGWALNGDGDDSAIPGCIVLTPAVTNRRGSAWRTDRIDLTRSFDQTYGVYLGANESGGDGLVYVLQGAGSAALGPLPSSGIGYAGITPSVGVEIDTRDQGPDPTFDHLAVNLNGSIAHAGHAPVQASASSPDVEDGEEHVLRVVWNAPIRTLAAYFDGDERILLTRDLVTDPFSGLSQVLHGFTAATGVPANLHYVCAAAECYGGDPKLLASIGDVTLTEGDAGTRQAHFPVTLSCPSLEPVTVSVRTADGPPGTGATAGQDYLPLSGSLTFEPGETSIDLVVEVVGDLATEPDEEFLVELSSPAGAELLHGRGVGRIVTDDLPVLVDRTEISEGDERIYPVRLDVRLAAAPTAPVTVSYATADGSATAGADYLAASGSLSFPAGQTERTLRIDLVGDRELEGDEDFFLRFTAPPGSPVKADEVRITILDDEPCPGPNLVRNGGAEEVLPNGELPYWTEVVDDEWTGLSTHTPFEGSRWFYAGLGPGAELAQLVDLSGYAEGIDAGTHRFEARVVVTSFDTTHLDASRMVVEYLNGPAGQILDVYDSGEHRNLAHWHLLDDVRTPPPGSRWARVRLISKRYNGTGDDGHFDDVVLRALEAPSVSVADVTLEEGSSGARPASFPVTLSCPRPVPVSVGFRTADGSARSGSDFKTTFGTLTFAPGELAKTIEVPVLGDTLEEGEEYFFLDLAGPVHAGLGVPRGKATILDDESVLAISDATATEGTAQDTEAVFTVSLSPPLDQPVRVDYATAEGTAEEGADYEAGFGTLTFEPGEVEKQVVVRVLADAEEEPTETFLVRLSGPVNAALADAEGLGTILEDDRRLSIRDAEIVEGSAGAAQVLFEVVLSSPSTQTVRVAWATEDALATAGIDYLAASGTVSFAPGQTLRTIPVSVLGDAEVEPSETFVVRLSAPENAALDVSEGIGFILDDDDCPSPNLLRNGGAEEPAVGSLQPGWTNVLGGQWIRRQGSPAPLEGLTYFSPGSAVSAEVLQDVDLGGFASTVDAGIQRFVFEGFLRGDSFDLGRFIVEFRDEANQTVLDRFDSGELPAPSTAWQPVVDLRTAPPGSRWARVRLLARRVSGSTNDAFFDRLSVRSLGLPFLVVEDQVVAEDDLLGARVPVRLTCSSPEPVTARVSTRDGSAVAGLDYEALTRTVVFEADDTVVLLAIPLIRDDLDEAVETFTLVAEQANVPLARPEGTVTILDRNAPPTLRVTGGFFLEGEGDPPVARFVFALSAPSDFPVEAAFRTVAGTAFAGQDFVESAGSVRLEPGQRHAMVEVVLLDDALDETHERFLLEVTSASGVSEVLQAPAEAVILDDDGSAASCQGSNVLSGLDARLPEGDRDSVEHFVLVTLACPAASTVSADYRTRAITASPGLDYVESSGRVTFAPGELARVVPVRVIGDRIADPGETFEVVLEPLELGVEAAAPARVEILDDDPVGSAVAVAPEVLELTLPEGATAEETVTVSVPAGPTVPRADVYLLADTTTSMGAAINAVRASAAQLVDDLRSALPGVDLRFGVGDYRDLPSHDPPFRNRQALTGDREAVIAAIQGLALAGGGTDLPEDQFYALDHLASDLDPVTGHSLGFRPEAEKILVWFGDAPAHDPVCARMTNLRHDITEALVTAKLRAAGITVIALSVSSNALDSFSTTGQSYLGLCGSQASAGQATRVAAATGGVHLVGVSGTILRQTIVAQTRQAVEQVQSVTLTLSPEVEPFLAEIAPASYGPLSTETEHRLEFAAGFEGIVACAPGEIQVFRGSLGVRFDGGSVAEQPIAITVPSCEGTATAELTVTDAEVVEGDPSGLLVFSVELSEPIDREVRVDFATEDGTAAAGEDYRQRGGTLVFAPGESTRSVEVEVIDDLLAEGDEELFVVLGGAVGAEIAAGRARGVIRDDEEPDAGEPELTATKIDSLAFDADGDGAPSPGDEIAYEVVVTNAGGAPATGVVFRDLAPAHTAIVAGSVVMTAGFVLTEDPVEVDLGSLEPGTAATIRFRVAVNLPVSAAVDRISNQGTVTSTELPAVLTDDPDLGGDADPTVTMLSAAPELVAEKTDRLATDADGDGAVSPGDELEYTVTVRNVGNTSATGVFLADPIPDQTAVVAGSVVASAGTVEDEDPVRVAVGEIAGGAAVEVRFRVRIENPIGPGVREVSNQGLVTSEELPDVVTDDPELDGPADPTVTVVTAAPELRVEKSDSLFEDLGSDGLASPGDVVLYRLTVANSGNTAATSVVLSDPIPEHTALEAGTVQTSQGTLVAEDPVTVELGQVEAGAEATVTFRVRLEEPFPLELLAVANQAQVESAELDPVPSDDPDTADEGDPTATEVFIVPQVSIDDVTVDEAAGAGSGAVFTVSLSEPSNRPVEVPYATADGPGSAATSPAAAGLDYLAAAGTLTLSPGAAEATITVSILDDLLDELDETFTLALGEPKGAVLADGAGLGTLLDDDPPPFVSVGDATVVEGDPGDAAVELLFPVTLSGPSGLGIAFDYATAPAASGRPAEPGADFMEVAGALAFPPGATAASIAVSVVSDRIDELDETLRVLLSNPLAVVLGDAEGEGTIVDDDEARVAIGDVTVEEGDAEHSDALFPVRLAVPADRPIAVDFRTIPGTAAEGEDFLPVAGSLAFPAGATEGSIGVPIVGDLVLEPLEESFTVELSEPTETTLGDALGVGTIVDDEQCRGPNLLANPGAESRPIDGEIPAWLEVVGTSWQRRLAGPDPAEGTAYFFAGEAELAELAQEVSVRAYEVRIDGGSSLDEGQRFAFTGRVRTFQESPPDTARVVVEYRDRTNAVVLDAFDSGEIASPDEWREVADVRTAPAGTGWIRVRLVATRFAGQANDGYFDDLALRSLRAPTLTVSDVTVHEGDSGETPARFTLRLACPFTREVTVAYATADGLPAAGANAGSDYRAVSGVLAFAPGETEATVPVPVLGDPVHERHESFFLDLSDAAPAGEVVLLDPRGEGLIANDDFCPRSHGFWKTHEELWPTDWLLLGGVEYGAAELAAFLASEGGDATFHLTLQLVATKLNLLVGSDPGILPVVEDAEAFLSIHPPGSDPKGADRQEAETLKDQLDAYNHSPCPETPVVPN